MNDLIDRALSAKRESKYIEFKRKIDFAETQTWCELIKDIVAMANTGGGVILVGVDNRGNPTGDDVTGVLEIDPAVLSDKIRKYTEIDLGEFEISERSKRQQQLAAIEISPARLPIVFTSPGTYEVVEGRQRTAFGRGTVYFRHGAKSEPGTNEDLRRAFEGQLSAMRKSWLGDVRKVVEAPRGTRVVTLAPNQEVVESRSAGALAIRVTDDPEAPAYRKLDYDECYPFRRKELVEEVKKRLGENCKVNSYDIQCVNLVHGPFRGKGFCHKPRYTSLQYSRAFVDWLVEQFRKNKDFFAATRLKAYEMKHS